MSDCLSPHVAPLQAGHTSVAWMKPRLGERQRVITWTCHCRSIIYELCSCGGRFYVRRTVRGKNRSDAETPRTSENEARALWVALLTGRAR